MDDDDLHAIRCLKNGDIQGLEVLVTRYQVKAVRAAFLIVRDEQTAQDVTQETFIRIFEHIQRFDENRPFGPYLLRSVVNAAFDAAKKTARWENTTCGAEAVEDLLEQAIVVEAQTSVEAQVEFNTLKEEIHAALGQLPARQRTSIVLRYFLELSEKEMATWLNTTPGTVKWLLFTAREGLRGLLNQRS
jgi:RNA polymerase sigma-70 factor, ECF subfamily